MGLPPRFAQPIATPLAQFLFVGHAAGEVIATWSLFLGHHILSVSKIGYFYLQRFIQCN
jgi:hypothetical protein